MTRNCALITALLAWLCASSATLAAAIEPVKITPRTLRELPMSIGGRMLVERTGNGTRSYSYQWPGTYFEAAFNARRVYFKIGPGDEILHVLIDNQPPVALTRPASGLYQVNGLSKGPHGIRIEVVTESQDAPGVFRGFALPAQATALPPPKRARQIEFIGDSYTVGYGNLSTKTACTPGEVWATTDNSRAFGPLTAKHYDADYQINAISGHGIVRNYNGRSGDPVPVAYPFVQFDKKMPYEDNAWHPQLIVIGLGTNDFSTQLNPGEKWSSREDLHSTYEMAYVKFVQSLRTRNSDAFFILMATDGANGEIQSEVKRVMTQLEAAGERKIAFIPMNGLTMTGCDSHPSTADDRTVSDELIRYLDGHPQLWQGK
ncbi:MAG: GDSL-type esterase/lipase family protein [Steroidobacteraceae bacterium]